MHKIVLVLTPKQGLFKSAFTAIKELNVFKSVDNPLDWQKEIRNEW